MKVKIRYREGKEVEENVGDNWVFLRSLMNKMLNDFHKFDRNHIGIEIEKEGSE